MALRFGVLAIDNIPGSPPEVRLHKDAFTPPPDSCRVLTKIAAFGLARLFKEQAFDALSLCPSPVFDFRR